MLRVLALLAALSLPAAARADTPGEFDYYVLSLSWSPNWCDREGRADGSPQCDPDAGFGWVLHGLWPQYERGWPDFCRTGFAPPSRSQTAAMADVMGTSGLAWHQWRKHGSCSGLSPADYYARARAALGRVTRPAILEELDRAVTLPASLIEEAFLRDNPGLDPDGITITCRDGQIQEARICLTRDLDFRRCGADVVRDCDLGDALFLPVE